MCLVLWLVFPHMADLSTTDDYRAHTTCITEAERYEGKKPKAKLSPQDAWMDMIGESVGKAPGHLQGYLSQMVTLSNVPRKAKPFRNFTANSLNLRGKQGDDVVTELWEFLQMIKDHRGKEKEDKQEPKFETKPHNADEVKEQISAANANARTGTKNLDETPPKLANREVKTPDKKTVKKAMKKVLKKHESLTVKALRKHVRVKLGEASKSVIKELVQSGLTDDKLFKVDGKIIKLRLSD